MILNRNDLKKIMYDFNSLCNRLLQADFNDYNGVLSKFVNFITDTEIIHDYIVDCGECEQDMDQEFNEVKSGNSVFELGETVPEEVRNIYSILKYIIENNINVSHSIGFSYSHSNKYQEILKDFNDRVVMVIIRHIESYLTKVGIDMGIDDKLVYNITVRDGQVNIANDNSSITATNNSGSIDINELLKLLDEIRAEANKSNLSSDDMEAVESSLDVIGEESKSAQPRKSFIKTAVAGLKAVKGTVEFAAAVATLIQFIQPLIG